MADRKFNDEDWLQFTPVLRDFLERSMNLAIDFWKPDEDVATGKPTLFVPPISVLEIPLGSAAQFGFTVQDDETSVGNPMIAFRVFDGIIDISSQGVFSPTADKVDSSAVWAISWSTTTQTLSVEGKTFRFEVEDGDNLKNPLLTNDETLIVIKINDPLKTLTNHPIAKSSDWGWE